MAVDGIATAKVFTWEDLNQNGLPDEGEPPISFVTTGMDYPDVLTDSDGRGSPSEFIPGGCGDCSSGGIVSVKTPPGYIPTTPIQYETAGKDKTYLFGFYPENKNDIVFFPNEPEWQKAFINRGNKVLAFHYSNGTLEITIDRDGSVSDDYYPESTLTDDQFYYDFFIFSIISELDYRHNVDIFQIQFTFMPSNAVFLCKTSDIGEWDGRISGYEILMQHCEHK